MPDIVAFVAGISAPSRWLARGGAGLRRPCSRDGARRSQHMRASSLEESSNPPRPSTLSPNEGAYTKRNEANLTARAGPIGARPSSDQRQTTGGPYGGIGPPRMEREEDCRASATLAR